MTPSHNNENNIMNENDYIDNSAVSADTTPSNQSKNSSTDNSTLNLFDSKPEDEIFLEEIHRHHHHHRRQMRVSASGRITYKENKHNSKSSNHKSDHKSSHDSKHTRSHSSNRRHSAKSKKKITTKKVLLGILIFLLVAVIGLVSAYFITKKLGKNEFLNKHKKANINTVDNADSSDNGHTVVYKGHTYKYNENLVSIVFLGIDKSELDSEMVGTSGQSDAIYIFTYDTDTKKCSFIPVSREIMTDVQLFSASGKALGFEKMQLCLAYAYGDGRQSSCQNTLSALSKVFYNIPFDACISLNWDAIAPLNDALGGITLKSLQSIPASDFSSQIPKDEYVTLMGKEAWSYVKYRDISKLTSNTDRLDRQKQYINAYLTQLIPMAKSDFSVIKELYGIANTYMYTNLSGNQIIYLASDILPNVYSAKDFNFVSIKGKVKQGKTYAEFYPNETSLYEAILKVFYTKIK